jgi:hypothetical protein
MQALQDQFLTAAYARKAKRDRSQQIVTALNFAAYRVIGLATMAKARVHTSAI